MEMREQEIKDLTDQEEELLRQISMTGYEQLKGQLASLNQLIESLARSKALLGADCHGVKSLGRGGQCLQPGAVGY